MLKQIAKEIFNRIINEEGKEYFTTHWNENGIPENIEAEYYNKFVEVAENTNCNTVLKYFKACGEDIINEIKYYYKKDNYEELRSYIVEMVNNEIEKLNNKHK